MSAAALLERTWDRGSLLVRLLPVAVALTVVTWHGESIVPATGIDHSWQLGLTLAARDGLDFGREVIFTYGPLGFLSVPTLTAGPLGALALLYALLVQVGVAAVVVLAATRLFGRTGGIVAAFAALGLTLLVSDSLVYLAFFGVLYVLEAEDVRASAWLVPGAGLVAAFELLVKLNGGLLCLALFALAAWRLAPRGWRSELVLAASFAVSVMVLWLISGNAPSALPTWLVESRRIVGSYTDAMARDPSGRTPETAVAAYLVLLTAVLLVLHVRSLPRARAVAILLAAAAYTYAYLKEGFVRHDAHALVFFGAIAVAALAVRWRGWLRFGAAAVVAGAAVGALATPEISLRDLYRPDVAARHAAVALRNVVDRHDVAAGRAKAQQRLGVPPAQLALLRDKSVDVVPYEISAVWAYGLDWRPEPLLQWYMAYDASLDATNARAVAARGAERILRQRVVPTDGKVPEFEAPATYLATLCNYGEWAATGTWETLARTGNRCGAPRPLATVHARAGATIAVPHADTGELVVAHVHMPTSRLLSLIAKPFTLPTITIGGTTHRLVAATAAGPLVMRAPPEAGRSPFFGGFTEYDSFALSQAATVEFDAIPIGAQRASLRPSPAPRGTLRGSEAIVGGARYAVTPGALRGWVDLARPAGGLGAITGWAVAPQVAVFAGGLLVALVRPAETRTDVSDALHDTGARTSGYSAYFPLAAHVRVFALGGGRATELEYPTDYPWK